ncbi:MAG: response regulator [Clostridiales bacterium]|jgi:two-component system response regulator YesN|nr:response regulator [Clostridiales bacterium]
MYSIIIVDDEETQRNGLCRLVDWAGLGFAVAACFEDGADALKWCGGNTADVILTDIKMAQVSGLELAERLRKQGADTQIVLLSGYGEFEYARQAIALGAADYLLKPVSLDTLAAVFTKIRRRLDERTAELREREDLAERLSRLTQYGASQFVNDVLCGALYDKKEIEERLRLISESALPEHRAALLTVRFPSPDADGGWQYGEDALYTAAANIIHFESDGVTFLSGTGDGGTLRVLALSDAPDFAAALREKTARIQAYAEELLRARCEILTDGVYPSVYALSEAFRGMPALAGDAEPRKLLLTHIICGNVAAVAALVRQMEADGAELRETTRIILEKLRETDPATAETAESADAYHAPSDVLLRLAETAACKLGVGDHAILKAKQYIDENFDKDITLFSAANHIFLSAAYFSRLFKERVGETFSNYLVKVRMEHAVALLRAGNYRVSDVCALVGYKDVKYFHRLFKKHYGVTPGEYNVRYGE